MRNKKLLYHSIFWAAVYLLWILVFRGYSFSITKTMTVEFCYLVFITAGFYAINSFIIPYFLLKKKYTAFVSATIGITVLLGWLRALVAMQMNKHIFHLAPINFSTLFLNSVINISLWVSLFTIAKMLLNKIQTQQQLDILEKERIKNELDYLKAQINPHALFNSLNTIYGHIDKNNSVAREILLQFSSLLQYQLYECGEEKVALEKEMLYLKNYVAFQKLRKDEKLLVAFNINHIDGGLNIAPLLLVVLIENAFKFVSGFSDKENRINISLSTTKNMLHCCIANTKEMQQPSPETTGSGGIGIANLERRLSLLYPKKYTLTVHNDMHFYKTLLTIDLA